MLGGFHSVPVSRRLNGKTPTCACAFGHGQTSLLRGVTYASLHALFLDQTNLYHHGNEGEADPVRLQHLISISYDAIVVLFRENLSGEMDPLAAHVTGMSVERVSARKSQRARIVALEATSNP